MEKNKNIAIKTIKLYQTLISPLYPPCCKFYPTCSNYAIEAIKKLGFIKGSFFSIYRILRCNPFSKGGVDRIKTKQ